MTAVVLPNSGERPSSALARGVRIREEQHGKINPTPQLPDDFQASLMLEDYLSPRKLRDLTGCDDLTEVTQLELRVDTTDTSLGNFGAHLPNLQQLKLSDSCISSLRDLGSSLGQLQVLWMSRCGLDDLQGVGSMSSLRELYLSFNEITDITPCSMVETLEILDVEGNSISDMNQIGTLAWCTKLYSLTLEGNPICSTSELNDSLARQVSYRQAVHALIPQLRILDDEPLLEATESSSVATEMELPSSRGGASAFESDWKLLDELMEEGTFVGTEVTLDHAAVGRPGTAGRPQTSGYRPGTALRPYTALRPRTGSSHSSPGTSRPITSSAARPGTSRSADSSRKSTPSDDAGEEGSSLLTAGGIVCGNPYRALSRRQGGKQTSSKHARNIIALARERALQSPIEHVAIDDDLANEIKEFKVEHAKKRKEISATKAPQVLVVNYDDAVSLSDGDSSDNDDSQSDDEGAEYLPLHSSQSSDTIPRQNHGNGNSRLSSSQYRTATPADSASATNSNNNTDGYEQGHMPRSRHMTPHPPASGQVNVSRVNDRYDNATASPVTDAPTPVIRSVSRTLDSPENANTTVSSLKSKLHKGGAVSLLPSKYPSAK